MDKVSGELLQEGHPPARILLVVEEHGSNDYWAYWAEVVRIAQNARYEIDVLDLTSLTRQKGISALEHPENFWFLSRWLSARSDFQQYCLQSGATWFPAGKDTLPRGRRSRQTPECPDSLTHLSSAAFSGDRLVRSVHSALATEILGDRTPPRSQMLRYWSQQVSIFLNSYNSVRTHLESAGYDHIVVANGRLPSQAATIEAAEDFRIGILYLEHGGTPGTQLHLRSWPANSYLRFKADFERFKLNDSEERDTDAISLAKTNRKGGSSKNRAGQRILNAVVFTSSEDEFIGLETAWDNTTGFSQEESIALACQQLKRAGFAVTVKIHPNMMLKSWRECRFVHQFYSRLNLDVVPAFETFPAEDLLDEADVVLTWGSTAGVEASARGIPTWLLGKAQYDSFADVRKWDIASPPLPEEIIYDVDASKARVYLERFAIRGSRLEFADADYRQAVRSKESRRLWVTRKLRRLHIAVRLHQSPEFAYRVSKKFAGRRWHRLMMGQLIMRRRSPC